MDSSAAMPGFSITRPTEEEAWIFASTYTRAHLEKVRQKREEIEWLKDTRVHPADLEIPQRILSMLESQLAELESGLTDWAKEHMEELLKEQ